MNSHLNKRWLNTAEAAAHIGVKPGTLEVWRSDKKGPRYSKLGTRVVYDLADLDAFAASRIVETKDTAEILKNWKRRGGGND